MEEYAKIKSINEIIMLEPTRRPVCKSYIVRPDFTLSAVYYDLELFRAEVGEDAILHTFFSREVKVGDWCISTNGCIARVEEVVRMQDQRKQDYTRLRIANDTVYYYDKVKKRKFYYTQFCRSIPTGAKIDYGKYGKQIITFVQNGMTFFEAVRVTLMNVSADTRRRILSNLFRNRAFIRDLTMLETIMQTDTKTLREEIEELGMSRKEFLENMIDIVRDPSKVSPGLATFGHKFVADALGLTSVEKIPVEGKESPINKDTTELRQVVSAEMRKMATGT